MNWSYIITFKYNKAKKIGHLGGSALYRNQESQSFSRSSFCSPQYIPSTKCMRKSTFLYSCQVHKFRIFKPLFCMLWDWQVHELLCIGITGLIFGAALRCPNFRGCSLHEITESLKSLTPKSYMLRLPILRKECVERGIEKYLIKIQAMSLRLSLMRCIIMQWYIIALIGQLIACDKSWHSRQQSFELKMHWGRSSKLKGRQCAFPKWSFLSCNLLG